MPITSNLGEESVMENGAFCEGNVSKRETLPLRIYSPFNLL